MAEQAKIMTLHDHDTGEAISPRTDVKALSGEGKKWNYVGFTEDDKVGLIEGTWPCNRNILDNPRWDKLEYIINQRNVSETIDTPGYFIDRWKLTSGTVQITSDGLVLNGTIVQILENDPGDGVIASVLTSDGLRKATYTKTNKTFTITATGQTILAAKLELGDTQTLAHKEGDTWVLNEIPDYETELLKCLRYQYSPTFNSVGWCTFGVCMCQGNNAIYTFVPLPVKMRVAPTIKFGEKGTTGLCLVANGAYNYYTDNGSITTTTVSAAPYAVRFIMPTGFTVPNGAYGFIQTNSYDLIFDANL